MGRRSQLDSIRNSLLELELGISGALNVTDKMEALAKALSFNQVFAVWEKLAFPSLKSLATWFADVLLRMEQLVEWTTALSLLKSLWISGFFNAMAFITALMQTTSRATQQPLDFMRQRSRFLNIRDHKELAGVPPDGVHVHGLFMEGAGWEEGKGDEEGYVTDSKMKELHPIMPVSNIIALHVDEMSWEAMYHCPVFITSLRRGPEKGAPDFVFLANLRMDPDDDEKRWVLAGAALLFTDE
jgi:dynein heavy chain